MVHCSKNANPAPRLVFVFVFFLQANKASTGNEEITRDNADVSIFDFCRKSCVITWVGCHSSSFWMRHFEESLVNKVPDQYQDCRFISTLPQNDDKFCPLVTKLSNDASDYTHLRCPSPTCHTCPQSWLAFVFFPSQKNCKASGATVSWDTRLLQEAVSTTKLNVLCLNQATF